MELAYGRAKGIHSYSNAQRDTTTARCLSSVQSQSYSSIEVVIVDDFSDDNAANIAKTFGAKVAQTKSNPALARNVGIANSAGKPVFVDSYQILTRCVVEECVIECDEEKGEMVRVPELFMEEGFWGPCSAEWKNYYVKVEKKFGAREAFYQANRGFFPKNF